MRGPRLTYANVVATLALFIALGGVSYAAVKLEKNSVSSKQIKNGEVKTKELGNNAVTGAKVKDGSLLPVDFGDSLVGPQGERGPQGPAGPTGATGSAGADGATGLRGSAGADGTDGLDGADGTDGDPATRLFAVVRGSGNLGSGGGVVSSSSAIPGDYTVVFNRSVAGCAAVATVGTGNPAVLGDVTQAGSTATVDLPATNPSNVHVQTTANAGGGLTSRSFHLAVFC